MAVRKRQIKTDWTRLRTASDAEIRQAVAADADAAPIVDRDWFLNARVVSPKGKKAVSIPLDADVVHWFKTHGRGYQAQINAVLRAYVDSRK